MCGEDFKIHFLWLWNTKKRKKEEKTVVMQRGWKASEPSGAPCVYFCLCGFIFVCRIVSPNLDSFAVGIKMEVVFPTLPQSVFPVEEEEKTETDA